MDRIDKRSIKEIYLPVRNSRKYGMTPVISDIKPTCSKFPCITGTAYNGSETLTKSVCPNLCSSFWISVLFNCSLMLDKQNVKPTNLFTRSPNI